MRNRTSGSIGTDVIASRIDDEDKDMVWGWSVGLYFIIWCILRQMIGDDDVYLYSCMSIAQHGIAQVDIALHNSAQRRALPCVGWEVKLD